MIYDAADFLLKILIQKYFLIFSQFAKENSQKFF